MQALRLEGRRAQANGDLALAIQKHLFALVLGLGGAGDLEYRASWTNRELLRRGAPAAEIERVLAPLVRELEPKEFGREVATDADVERLRELCDRYLGPLVEEAA